MEGITFDQILALLKPTTLWDYLLYIILVFGLITLFQQPEGSVLTTILLAMVIVGVFIDKIQAFPDHACNFGTLIIRILYFVVPLVTAGITKNPKSRPPAVIMAVLGLGYMFFLWATQMNNPAVCVPLARETMLPLDWLSQLPI